MKDEIIHSFKVLIFAEIGAIGVSVLIMVLGYIIDGVWTWKVIPIMMGCAFIIWIFGTILNYLAEYWFD